MPTVLLNEAREEARRLTKTLNRDVEVSPVSCPCDYDRMCGRCGGEGVYYELLFADCGHDADDGEQDSCIENYCRERGRAAMELESAPVNAQIKSCREIASEQSETEWEEAMNA